MQNEFNKYYKGLTTACFFMLFLGCNKPNAEVSKPSDLLPPGIEIAPLEFEKKAENSMLLWSQFKFDEWGKMLSDSVVFALPDGNSQTRTKIKGRDAVVNWWKNWQQTSGIQSMTLTPFNSVPINTFKPLHDGYPSGVSVFSYFDNTLVFKHDTASMRMNFVVFFDQQKLVSAYFTYFDYGLVKEAEGK
ncbi:MAG: hypothetical protein WCR52_17840 [Bacteroidota bacterium]